MWSAVEGLAGQYRAVDDTLSVPESRADALTDLVAAQRQVSAQVTLGVPVVTDRPAPDRCPRRDAFRVEWDDDETVIDAVTGERDPLRRPRPRQSREELLLARGADPRPTPTAATVMAARRPPGTPSPAPHLPGARLGRRRHRRQPPHHPPHRRRPRRPRRRHRHPGLPHHHRLPATREPSPTSSRPATAPAGCGAAPEAADHTDLDHTRPWPDGPTTPSNLAALCRRHHRMKQLGRWRPTLDPDGTLTWHDPNGRTRTTEPQHRTTGPTPAPGPPIPTSLADIGPPPF